MNQDIQKTRTWIAKRQYHGMVKDVAEATGLTTETIRKQLKQETKASKATNTVLEAAAKLINQKSMSLQEAMRAPSAGDLHHGEEDPA